jgi:acetyl esterase/lipase
VSVLGALLAAVLAVLVLAACSSSPPIRRAAVAGLTAGPQALLDLPYATISPAQKLDLYLPQRRGVAVPLVIDIHGGAWAAGTKEDAVQNVEPLRARGYAVASINYRLAREARFPAAVQDTKTAIRWLRTNARQYGLNPDQFALWGFSAGGNLAALAGVTGRTTVPEAAVLDDLVLGNPTTSGAVQAVVDFYGISDLLSLDAQGRQPGGCVRPARYGRLDSSETLWLGALPRRAEDRARAASPVTYLGRGQQVPPFFIAHGGADCLVPADQSVELANALQQDGVRTELVIVPGVGHANAAFNIAQTGPAIAFLDSVFGRLP